jgi:hypothetical protein
MRLKKTIGLTMMVEAMEKAVAPGVDVISGSELPPFYTVWEQRHPRFHKEKCASY